MLAGRHIAAGLVVAVALIGESWAQSPQSPSGQQQPRTEQRDTNEATIIIKIQQPEQTKEKIAADTDHHMGDGWLASWTLADRIAGIASVAAFLQFLALIATIFIMVRNGRRQLRAYLPVEPGTTFRQSKKHRAKFEFRPTVVNNGQTPASNVKILSKVDFGSPSIPHF
jgi:hypothetical protein